MSSRHLEMTVHEQSWPLDNPFRTARGPSTETRVVVVTISDGRHVGRGEGVPIRRYGQDVASSAAELNKLSLTGATTHAEIQTLLPANAARNCFRSSGSRRRRVMGLGSESRRRTRLGIG